jgi:ribonuclease HI
VSEYAEVPSPPPGVVHIYTDGSNVSGNPGFGGWAALMLFVDQAGTRHEKMLSGSRPETTNNIAEMAGVFYGLRAIHSPCKVTVFSDSKYTVNGCSKWVHSWRGREWKTADEVPPKNLPQWQRILAEIERLAAIGCQVKFQWVRGHAGNPGNEAVDQEARRMAMALRDQQRKEVA